MPDSEAMVFRNGCILYNCGFKRAGDVGCWNRKCPMFGYGYNQGVGSVLVMRQQINFGRPGWALGSGYSELRENSRKGRLVNG